TMLFLRWLDPVLAERAEMVPDPTFSIDIISTVDREALKIKLRAFGVDFSRPRLILCVRNSTCIDEAVRYFKARGFQAVSVTFPNALSDVDLSREGFTPPEWASVFGLMDAGISERMHACISCILNNTPFIGIDRYKLKQGDSKIEHLMRFFGIDRFYHNTEEGRPDTLQAVCGQVAEGNWPVDGIAEKRTELRKRSDEFASKMTKISGPHSER
ncbi:MAG: polysaccharide pyruvyl transferase family protein, partial [Candidatus Omnitrophica bacterium]|nr:polysaccharide pyruvyl transferase family protein [Candidatus Omnitrophota bacterium]